MHLLPGRRRFAVQGVITPTTKEGLEQLESEKSELEISIEKERIKKPVLTKEQIVYWIKQFKDGCIDEEEYKKAIIEMFIHAIYLYDDEIRIAYNYSGEYNTVDFELIESCDKNVYYLDLALYTPPEAGAGSREDYRLFLHEKRKPEKYCPAEKKKRMRHNSERAGDFKPGRTAKSLVPGIEFNDNTVTAPDEDFGYNLSGNHFSFLQRGGSSPKGIFHCRRGHRVPGPVRVPARQSAVCSPR